MIWNGLRDLVRWFSWHVLVCRDACDVLLHRLPFWISPAFWLTLLTHPFRLFLVSMQVGPWRHLLLGLPASVMVLTVAGLHQWAWNNSEAISFQYLKEARGSLESRDFERASIMLDRVMLDAGDQQPDALLSVARLLMETGQEERAEFLLKSMAPDDSTGIPEAHRLRAMALCERLSPGSSGEEFDCALHHLQSAGDRVTPEMLLAWGRYYVSLRDLPAARDMFEQIREIYPEVQKPLGTIYLELGYREQALGSFSRAREFLRKRLESNPRDRTTREDYASVLICLGEISAAREVIEEGRRLDPEGPWKSLVASLHVILHDVLVVEESDDTDAKLQELSAALEEDPDCVPALERLAGYIQSDPGANTKLKSVLFRSIASSKSRAVAHLMLGNIYWMESNAGAAVFHFERSVELNPGLVVVLNNLAWVLAHSGRQEDLPRALSLIEAALAQAPGVPRLLDTRGAVLMKMERWREALKDLEQALSLDPEIPGLHARLADVYQALDHPELAAEHRRLAVEWPAGLGRE